MSLSFYMDSIIHMLYKNQYTYTPDTLDGSNMISAINTVMMDFCVH